MTSFHKIIAAFELMHTAEGNSEHQQSKAIAKEIKNEEKWLWGQASPRKEKEDEAIPEMDFRQRSEKK